MAIQVTSRLYADYLGNVYALINSKGDFITKLDSATGDGDHWSNLNMGFSKLADIKDDLAQLTLFDAFKKIGMTMMSVIGGSSGVLYGGAYLAAAKTLEGKEVMNKEDLLTVLDAMLKDMMTRGKAEPGMKTMIDALHPAVEAFKNALENNLDDYHLLDEVCKAAENGAESTREMEAVKGRASYQANKGVGHLDPGAVTMAYQICELCATIQSKLQQTA